MSMKTRQELQTMCLTGWEQCEAHDLLDATTMTAVDIEDNAYEILSMGGNVDELTEEEFIECMEILTTMAI